MHNEISIAMPSTIQTNLYRADIIQHNARNYYTNQILGKWLQTHAANIHILRSPSICSNRAVSSMRISMIHCIVLIEYSSIITISGNTGSI